MSEGAWALPGAVRPYELRRVSDREWLIYDVRFPMNDARCLVACIWQSDEDEAEVVWIDGRSRPTTYVSPEAVMEDLTLAAVGGSGGTRPIEIPHLPPPRLVG